MCGIVGMYNVNMSRENIIEMINNLKIRGRDGFGVLIKESDNNYFTKIQVKEINELNERLSRINFKDKIILGNSRAMPEIEYLQGAGDNVINLQPFENNEWIVVHNGGISNDWELRKKYDIKTKSKVDSAILPHLFSKVGIIEGLKEIEGSYAIIAYNLKDKSFWFGSNFMPLHYVITNKGEVIVASLREMFTTHYDLIKEVPPYTLYRYANGRLDSFSLFRKEPNKKVLVICSGGIDSTTTAYLYNFLGYQIHLLHFNYGQAAEKAETFSVKQISKHLKVPLIIYNARPLFKHFKKASLLLSQKKADPSLAIKDAESTLSYVPNRNMIFASIAAALAEMHKIDTVALGAQQMDGIAYPDNNIPFIESLDKTLKYSLNWYTNVRFRAPFIHLIKHEIISIGLKLGVPYEYVTSCYYPKLKNNKIISCGECGCCQFRLGAFAMLGVKDPGTFKTKPNIKREVIPEPKIDLTKEVYPYA
jgi:7-cyano-7-deazaguanine synthase